MGKVAREACHICMLWGVAKNIAGAPTSRVIHLETPIRRICMARATARRATGKNLKQSSWSATGKFTPSWEWNASSYQEASPCSGIGKTQQETSEEAGADRGLARTMRRTRLRMRPLQQVHVVVIVAAESALSDNIVPITLGHGSTMMCPKVGARCVFPHSPSYKFVGMCVVGGASRIHGLLCNIITYEATCSAVRLRREHTPLGHCAKFSAEHPSGAECIGTKAWVCTKIGPTCTTKAHA